jgi:hypothetical protein
VKSKNYGQIKIYNKPRKAHLNVQNKQLEESKQIVVQKEKSAKESADKNIGLQTNGENEMLLSQLHQVQEELEKYYLENQELKRKSKSKTPARVLLFGAAERVKNDLPYRLGALMINHSRSFGGWASMLFALSKEKKRFAKERGNKELPTIEQYTDAQEAERVKKHLSYRLGTTWLKHNNVLTLPSALLKDVREFREYRKLK